MDNILVSLVSLALIIIATVTMTVSTFQSTNALTESWKSMQERSNSIIRTEISTSPPQDYQGGMMDFAIRNTGQTNLYEFSRWDAIVQYPLGNACYLAYSASYPPGNNQWAVEGIYLSEGVPEVFEPHILNPGEMMVVSVILNPEIGEGETARITISTPNGVTSQCQVTRPPPP